MERKLLDIEFKDARYRIRRLNNDERRTFWRQSVPIQLPLESSIERMRVLREPEYSLQLGEIYSVMKSHFGPSSDWYDDWKSSFDFPFLVGIKKGDSTYYYLLAIGDYRGGIEFRFRKILGREEDNDFVARQPVDDELSGQDMNRLVFYLWGFIQGYLEVTRDTYQPFFRRIDSWIIYGLKDGEFFEHAFDTQDDFHDALKKLSKTVPEDKDTYPEVSLRADEILGDW